MQAVRGVSWERVHPERVDELRRLWAEGVPTRTIAQGLGVSMSTLWLVTCRLGLPRRQSPVPGKVPSP
jgi:hypothetical protein